MSIAISYNNIFNSWLRAERLAAGVYSVYSGERGIQKCLCSKGLRHRSAT